MKKSVLKLDFFPNIFEFPAEKSLKIVKTYNFSGKDQIFPKFLNFPGATNAFKATQQLFRLANDTNDIGDRVIGMVREILAYVGNEQPSVRGAALEILGAPHLLMRIVVELGIEQSISKEILVRIHVARHDPIEAVSEIAERLWIENHLQVKQVIGAMLVGTDFYVKIWRNFT